MGGIRSMIGRSGLIPAAFILCVNVQSSYAQISTSDPVNLVPNPSFEVNGQPTLQFWVADTFLTAFVQDTPPGGGTWSLRISPGWIPQEGYARMYVTGLSGVWILQLTVWIKSLNGWPGSASLGQWSKGGWVTNKKMFCDSTSWTQISIVDTLSLHPIDTVAIDLSAGVTEVAYGEDLFDLVRLVSISTAVSVQETLGRVPAGFSLEQNYPNPFNPSTTIKFELPRSSDVSLVVYDILGRQVSVLVSDRRNAGAYEVKFAGSNLASGVYFYRLQTGDFVATKRFLLLK